MIYDFETPSRRPEVGKTACPLLASTVSAATPQMTRDTNPTTVTIQ
jgi:hypothetical protein